MPDRLYIPSAYVDEICSAGRANPDAWIGAPAGDVWLLATEEGCDFGITLRPGEIVLFDWVQDLGEVAVEIRADGTHTAQGEVPDGATHFQFGGDPDTLADTLDDFVAGWREMNIAVDEGETVLVRTTRWADKDEPFHFVVDDRGPRFIRAAPSRTGGDA